MVFGLTLGGSVGNYAYAAYMQKFLVNSVGMPRTTASLMSVLSLIGFSGTVDYIAPWTRNIGHENWFFWYVPACVGASLICHLWMPETKTMSLIDRD